MNFSLFFISDILQSAEPPFENFMTIVLKTVLPKVWVLFFAAVIFLPCLVKAVPIYYAEIISELVNCFFVLEILSFNFFPRITDKAVIQGEQ
ncbi:MAG: hypothetical protein NTU74_00450 [Deltaproteobacteria bacterium]|nr:hypothetical protein [Deltaproteobacteria bacterium]